MARLNCVNRRDMNSGPSPPPGANCVPLPNPALVNLADLHQGRPRCSGSSGGVDESDCDHSFLQRRFPSSKHRVCSGAALRGSVTFSARNSTTICSYCSRARSVEDVFALFARVYDSGRMVAGNRAAIHRSSACPQWSDGRSKRLFERRCAVEHRLAAHPAVASGSGSFDEGGSCTHSRTLTGWSPRSRASRLANIIPPRRQARST